MLVSPYAAPRLTSRFWPVVMRNLLVWKKLAGPSILGNIAEHLESDVVEVYGDGAADTAATHGAFAERVETSGETVFFYLREPKRLLDALAAHHDIRYLHRPANLEDLFLKLTGRKIRDDA